MGRKKIDISMLANIRRGWIFTALSVLLNMVAVKIIAVILGPGGTGIYSILDQFIKFSTTLGSVGGRMPLTQGIAAVRDRERGDLLVSAAIVYLVATLILVSALLLYRKQVLDYISVGDVFSSSLIVWVCVSVILAVATEYCAGFLNGSGELDHVFQVQLFKMLGLALLAYPISHLILNSELNAYVWLFCGAFVAALIYAIRAMRSSELWLEIQHKVPSARHVKTFFFFSVMVLMGTLVGQGGVFLSRIIVARNQGIEAVGILDAAWAISATYTGLLLNSIGVYTLPKISGESELKKRNEILKKVLTITIMVATAALSTAIAIKPLLIRVLYSAEFIQSLDIIKWMLAVELIKIVGWVFSIPILAQKHGFLFFVTNFLFIGVFNVLLYIGVAIYDSIEMIGIAYAISSIGYTLSTIWIAQNVLGYRIRAVELYLWLYSYFIVLLMAALFWNDYEVVVAKLVLAALLLGAAVSFMLRRWGKDLVTKKSMFFR